MDGGITDGTDVFKALALGARMVFIGRPALWGLACGGEEGTRKILSILKTEFEYALAISGKLRWFGSLVAGIFPSRMCQFGRCAPMHGGT